jgi:hypothetical protein
VNDTETAEDRARFEDLVAAVLLPLDDWDA